MKRKLPREFIMNIGEALRDYFLLEVSPPVYMQHQLVRLKAKELLEEK